MTIVLSPPEIQSMSNTILINWNEDFPFNISSISESLNMSSYLWPHSLHFHSGGDKTPVADVSASP